jgi:hypothetical protein
MSLLENPKTVWSLAAISLFLGLVYLLNDFLGRPVWFFTLLFDMDRENTLQSWFSGFLLILCALYAWDAAETQNKQLEKYVWRSLAALFLFFSADEIAMLHERLSQTLNHLWHFQDSAKVLWPVILSPLLVLLLGSLIWAGRRVLSLQNPAHQKMILGLGIFVFAAMGTEMFVHNAFYQAFGTVLVFMEETCEMLGVILVLSGLRSERIATNTVKAWDHVTDSLGKAAA